MDLIEDDVGILCDCVWVVDEDLCGGEIRVLIHATHSNQIAQC